MKDGVNIILPVIALFHHLHLLLLHLPLLYLPLLHLPLLHLPLLHLLLLHLPLLHLLLLHLKKDPVKDPVKDLTNLTDLMMERLKDPNVVKMC